MTPIEIATAALALLSPYLVEIGKEVTKKAGNAAWDKAAEIHQIIKNRFKNEKDSYPQETLKQFKKNPEKRQGAMIDVLVEIMEKDSDFSGELARLLIEARNAGAEAVFNITNFGEIGTVINIDQLKGGLKIDRRKGMADQ